MVRKVYLTGLSPTRDVESLPGKAAATIFSWPVNSGAKSETSSQATFFRLGFLQDSLILAPIRRGRGPLVFPVSHHI